MAKYCLYLASQSPRRSQLLHQAGFEFHVDSVKVSEIIDENLNLPEAVEKVAKDKAEAFVQQHKHLKAHKNLILSADTIVHLKGEVLGKPKNLKEARHFLDRLSGAEHCVITGFCFLEADTGRSVCGHDQTSVQFRPLSQKEVEAYLLSGEGMDKAGGYGIQGSAKKFIHSYKGSLTNVIGLPLEQVEKIIKENNWEISRAKS